MIIFTPTIESKSKSNPYHLKYDGVKKSFKQYLSNSFEEETYKNERNEESHESEEKMKIKKACIFRSSINGFNENYATENYEILTEISSPLSTQNKANIPHIYIFNFPYQPWRFFKIILGY